MVTFTKTADSNILTFPTDQNREYPLNDTEGHKGALLRTGGGTIAVDVRKTSNPLQIPLTLRNITQAFYDALENWFLNVCKNKLYKFYYSNDVTGESLLAVRWINGFSFSFDGFYYYGEIILEKEIT